MVLRPLLDPVRPHIQGQVFDVPPENQSKAGQDLIPGHPRDGQMRLKLGRSSPLLLLLAFVLVVFFSRAAVTLA